MNGAASRGLRTRRPATRYARSRARPIARSRSARNVMRAAAKSQRATKRASLSLTIIGRHSSPLPFTTATDSSAARFIIGARFSRAKCTRAASPAATAITRTVESYAPRGMLSAPPAICRANTTPRRTIITSLQARAPHAWPVTCRPPPTWSSIRGMIIACACPGRICP